MKIREYNLIMLCTYVYCNESELINGERYKSKSFSTILRKIIYENEYNEKIRIM